ncbi:hypothetical protein vseg_003932 [Gypsophila vaccaria]
MEEKLVNQQTKLQQKNNIIKNHVDNDDDDLDLCLGPRHQKRKAVGVIEEGGGLDRRRKAVSWWGQNGLFFENNGSGGGAAGGGENSFSTGTSSGGSDSYYSNSNAGGHSSDTSSHSSHSRLHLPAANHPGSSNEKPNRNSSNHNHSHNRSSSNVTSTEIKDKEPNSMPRSPSPRDSKVVIGKPPKPKRQMSQQSVLLPQMPCVSTTGNGPEGKTITGFLYKYSKAEVSIVCVCHGTSFSPAGFVEHAGGVDVEHPLRHIRVAPFALS